MKGCHECIHGYPNMQGYCKDSLADKCSPGWRLFEARGASGQDKTDDVNHPSHYTDGPACPHCGKPIECITITERMSFTIGSAFKYLWRNGKKDGNPRLKDLKKAAWYINREIEREERAAK